MQYQVLARKWRPRNFHELVGQEHVSRTLMNALHSGRVAHAFLFSGPRGSGKTTTARILAKALNCHAGKPGEPCGECPACVEIAAGNCMDVLEIDAASNTGVDNVRSLIEQVQYNPARDRNRIFIIDEVHMLSNAAFNALLKTLEEPPPHVVFIMATTEYHKIPATILSRCQQYSFKLIKYPLILDRLRFIAREEKIRISASALEQVTFSSGGSMRDAMSALDQVIAFSGETVRDEDVTMLLGLVEPAVLAGTVRAIAAADVEALLKTVAELVEAGQDLQNFCRRLLGQFRNLMVLKAGVADPALLGVPESLIPDLRAQADLFTREDLLRLFEAFLKIEGDLRYASQARFGLEMGLIELSYVARMRSLEDLIAEFRGEIQEEDPPLGQRNTQVPPLPDGSDRPAPARHAVTPVRSDALPRTVGRATAVTSGPDGRSPEPVKSPPPASGVSRELLSKIAAAVGKESLESSLSSLEGAEVRGDTLVIHTGSASDFYRRQIRENMPLITRAASEIVGRPVTVQLDESQCGGRLYASDVAAPAGNIQPPPPDPLERAKREPVVKSFLDLFPGPVKAEDIDQ
jgi:DNA polymerase-3 subunit gamma/tau